MKVEVTGSLLEIGLSALESQVYVTLIQQPGLTGYKIAQILGKPVPNTYKALEALQKKGVVLVSHNGRTRRYSVLPVGDFLDQLERDFRTKRSRVEEALKTVTPLALQDGVYSIDNVEQFFQRVRRMIREAKEAIAVDACSGPLERILALLVDASERTPRVVVKVYSPENIPGCDTIFYDIRGTAFEEWPVEWLHVFVDGREYVMGLFEKESGRLVQAVWSNSPYLSMMAYNGFMCEIVLSQVIRNSRDRVVRELVAAQVEKYRPLFIQHLGAVNEFIKSFEKIDLSDVSEMGDG